MVDVTSETGVVAVEPRRQAKMFNPNPPLPPTLRSGLVEYLEKWSIPEPNTGCWLWIGGAGPSPSPSSQAKRYYGSLNVEGKRIGPHVASYEAHVGPVPKGKELHHICGQPSCINPEHLEPVTREEHRERHMSDTTSRLKKLGRPRK